MLGAAVAYAASAPLEAYASFQRSEGSLFHFLLRSPFTEQRWRCLHTVRVIVIVAAETHSETDRMKSKCCSASPPGGERAEYQGIGC